MVLKEVLLDALKGEDLTLVHFLHSSLSSAMF